MEELTPPPIPDGCDTCPNRKAIDPKGVKIGSYIFAALVALLIGWGCYTSDRDDEPIPVWVPFMMMVMAGALGVNVNTSDIASGVNAIANSLGFERKN